MTLKIMTAGLALSLLAACQAVQLAQLDVPSSIAQDSSIQRLALTGLGSSSGRYTVGQWQGEYTTSASAFGAFDNLFTSSKSSSGFTISGPGFDQGLVAQCAYRDSALSLDFLSFELAEGAYKCTFKSSSGEEIGGLVLGEPKPNGLIQFDTKSALEGRVWVNGQALSIASSHKAQGVALQVDKPLGYIFKRAGYPVATADLNTRTLHLPNLSRPDELRSALAGALAVNLYQNTSDNSFGPSF
ncbi:hypothetical protein [Coralliovum pocilloporae]|uniref:hypothetical protein n=1 Tax=Coralliovum pocilloporae TaxID=3066369 RepID=UPI00330762A3